MDVLALVSFCLRFATNQFHGLEITPLYNSEEALLFDGETSMIRAISIALVISLLSIASAMGQGMMGYGRGQDGYGPGMGMGTGMGMAGGGMMGPGMGPGMMMGMSVGSIWAKLPAAKQEQLRKLQASVMQSMSTQMAEMQALMFNMHDGMSKYPIDTKAVQKHQEQMCQAQKQMATQMLGAMAQAQEIVGKDLWEEMMGAGSGPGGQMMGPGTRR